MRKVLASFVVIGFAATSAFGGMAGFTPPTVDVIPGVDMTADFDVAVETATGGDFQAIGMLFGSLDGLSMSFAYDPAFEASCSMPVPTPVFPYGVYAAIPGAIDLGNIGGNNFGGWDASALPMLIGTVTVDTSGLTAANIGDSYDIVLDPATEMNLVGTELSFLYSMDYITEGLCGVGTINVVVPEPAALVLLGIGGLVALWRRRK